MKRLILLVALVALPSVVSAQNRWNYAGPFPADSARIRQGAAPAEVQLTADRYVRQAHGIDVDPEGKVWIVTFNTGARFVYADTVLNGDSASRPKIKSHAIGQVRVYNPDGTEASFSPITYGVQNGVRTDTLGVFCGGVDATSGRRICESRTGRGLRIGSDGSVYVSLFDTIFRLDHRTGAMLGKVKPYAGTPAARASLISPGVDDAGNVYVRLVTGTAPGVIFSRDLSTQVGTFGDPATFGVSRAMTVSPDGNKIYFAGYTQNSIQLYKRASDLDPFPTQPDTVLKGISAEAIDINPATGDLWVGAGGNTGSGKTPNGYPSLATSYQGMTYYGFNRAQIETQARPTRIDSMKVQGTSVAAASLRGIAFNSAGTTAYILRYDDSNAPNIQKFTLGPVAVEPVDRATSGLSVRAYPNPARGAATVEFGVATPGRVSVKVYDAMGREVATLVDEDLLSGTYRTAFEGTGLPAGTYLYRVTTGDRTATGTLVLVQ